MAGGAPRPFEGIRILDLTHVLAGPFCTYQLAVLGAETIKIEEPGKGDIARQTGSDRALNRRLMGTGYMTQGANKRCLTLDLKDPRGRDILRRLVARADVLVENFRSGAMAALGFGYEDLRAINPRLIYCSMTGFGQEGPKADHNAYDCVIQAISGLMSTTGWPAMPPLKTGAPIIDYASGLSAAFAISCALFQRERAGRGQRVDCAMLDTALMLMSSHLTAYLWSGVAPKPRGNDLEYAGVSAYQTKDGTLMLGSFREGQHRRLWTALGRPDLAALWTVQDQEEHGRSWPRRSARSCSHGPPRSGRRSWPGSTCQRHASGTSPRRWHSSSWNTAICCTGSRRSRTSIGRSTCPSRPSGSLTAGRVSTRRRGPSAPIPTRSWASWA